MYMMSTKSEGGNATLDSKYAWRGKHKKAGQHTVWPTNQNPSYEHSKDYRATRSKRDTTQRALIGYVYNVYVISLLPVYIVESIE